MKRSKFIAPALVITLTGATLFGATQVYAQTPQSKYPPIVQKLVQRFGLSEDEVKKVFDEARQERQDQHQQQVEERLSQAVADGKITEDQKKAILAKMSELQQDWDTKSGDLQNMTQAQRKAAFHARKQDLQTWAKENKIDFKFFFGRMGGMNGHRMMR